MTERSYQFDADFRHKMKQEEITQWERGNQHNIAGWDIAWGYKNEKKEWEWYDGFQMVIFKMIDETTVEFKRENTNQ